MRLHTLATLGMAAGLLTTSMIAQRIKVSTQTVPIYATVLDGQRRLVTDLQREDFEVYDNEKLQTLTNFVSETTPFTAVVMLDTSGSMTLNLDFVKQAAEEFLIRMLPEDRAKVGSFNDKIQILPRDEPFTGNRDRLIRLLKEDLDFGYPTRLWDAVDESIAQMEALEGRRVVVVFTDGDDSASKRGRDDVLERAREKDMMVYAVGLASEYFNGQSKVRSRPDRGLTARGRRDRRRVLRALEEGRARPDLHESRAGAAQSVRDGLHAGSARRQDSQARSAGEAARPHRTQPQELRRNAARADDRSLNDRSARHRPPGLRDCESCVS